MRNAISRSSGLQKMIVVIPLLLIQMAASDFISYQYDCSNTLNVAQADMADSWYDEGWKYRKEIIIDDANVEGETFIDYPLLFSATDAAFKDIGNGGKTGEADGADILFTAADGTTKISHEIEEYDPVTGRLAAWVRVPALSNTTDTKLYVYYGNANTTDQQDTENVWPTEYEMVQHMDGTSSLQDSTANGNDGTKSGATLPQEVQGKVGKSQAFGENGSIVVADNDSLDLNNGDWTISFWLKSDNGDGGEIFSKGHAGNEIGIKKTEADKIWGAQDSLENLNFNMPRYIWGDDTYLYITDSSNNRIVKRRAADLSYVSSLGTFGTGNDQFASPRGIWGDGTYLYIADADNDRIVKRLASDLSFVSSIGTYGTGNDQFDTPTGIWGDGTNLYVTDTNNHRLMKRLASDLSFIATAGANGTTTSLFNFPRGIYCDGTYLYIADTNNNRIIKRLASTLAYVSYIGGTASGTGDNQFNRPWGVWGDGVNLYVVDSNNNRIVKRLASTLAYISKSEAIFNYPEGVCGDGTYLYVADTSSHRIGKYLASDFSFVSQLFKSGSGVDQFSTPQGGWNDGIYSYIVDSGNHRIVKRMASDFSYVSSFGTLGSGIDQFNDPRGMWGDGTYFYITDTLNNRIVKRLASDFSFVSSIGTTGAGNDQFNQPAGIWGDDTHLYITDVTNSRIVKRLKSDLSYVSSVGVFGSGDEQLHAPRNLWGDGTYLFILDTNNNRIVKRLASDLSLVSIFGTFGTGPDQFANPYAVWGDGTYLYLLDTYNQRLMKRSLSDLSYVSSVGILGTGPDQFNYAKGLWGDGDYLYITDSGNHRIMKRMASDLSLVSQLNSASVTSYSSSLGESYTKFAVVKSHPDHQPQVISIYKDGVLDVSGSSTAADDFFNNAEALVLGNFLTGEIDELRFSSEAQDANLIKTEYNNQSSPQTFAIAAAEEIFMDHFQISGSDTQTAGQTQDITITAIDSSGAVKTAYTGEKSVTLLGADPAGDHTPTFTDRDGVEINFGSSGVILFANGVATTSIKLYKAEMIEIDISSGAYDSAGDTAHDLDLIVSPASLDDLEIVSASDVTSETPFSLTINARDAYANITTLVSEAIVLEVNLGSIDISSIQLAEFTDDGTYTANLTVSEIEEDTSVVLSVTSGSVASTRSLSVVGLSHSSTSFLPAKPVVSLADILANALPKSVDQIAISRNASFENVSWEPFDHEKLMSLLDSPEVYYLKFRNIQGGISDVVSIGSVNQSAPVLQEGDIVKTADSCDVYIIKYKNNKQYKRLILSPNVFASYGHLKWGKIKVISQTESDKYVTSNLVKETLDAIIYLLFPNGDTGERRGLDTSKPYDADSVYEINATDRDSYRLSD